MFRILLFCDQTGTGATTPPDMVVETGGIALSEGDSTLSQGEHLIYQIQILGKALPIGIRTIIFGAIPYHPPCLEDFRKWLVGYTDQRIALTVFERDVVVRVVLLDQVVFQYECLVLIAGDDVFNLGDLAHQELRLDILATKEV